MPKLRVGPFSSSLTVAAATSGSHAAKKGKSAKANMEARKARKGETKLRARVEDLLEKGTQPREEDG